MVRLTMFSRHKDHSWNNSQHYWNCQCNHSKRKNVFRLIDYDCCISTPTIKLEMTIFCDSQLLTGWDNARAKCNNPKSLWSRKCPRALGPLRTRAKSCDHEIVRAWKKVLECQPKTPSKSCSVVMDHKCSVKSYMTGPSTKCYFNKSLFMQSLTHDKIK